MSFHIECSKGFIEFLNSISIRPRCADIKLAKSIP